MSSVNHIFTADRCIDGHIDNFCHTTNHHPFPWLAMEYVGSITVVNIKIYNRNDCCGDKTKDLEVYVSNTLPHTAQERFPEGNKLGSFKGPGTNGEVIELAVAEEEAPVGKFVIIQMQSTHINLAEVTVFGESV